MLKSPRLIPVLLTTMTLLGLAACQPEPASSAAASAGNQAPTDLPKIAQANSDLIRLQPVFQQLLQLKNFDEEKIEAILNSHNQKQTQVASDQQENPDWVLYDAGAWVLSLEQIGESSFTVLLRKVEQAHSAGVDAGVDQLQTLIFKRQTLQLMRVVDGKLENWQTDGLQIVGGNKESCLGVRTPTSFTVLDLKQGAKTILTQALEQRSDETSMYQVNVKSPQQLAFITTSDQPYSGKPEHAKTCDVGDWVDKLETSYTINCEADINCKVSKSVKHFAGCQLIGGCD